jgi:hypothetical protein
MFHTRQRHRYAADKMMVLIDIDVVERSFYAQDDPSLLGNDPFVYFFEVAKWLRQMKGRHRRASRATRTTFADIIASRFGPPTFPGLDAGINRRYPASHLARRHFNLILLVSVPPS